MDHRRENTIQPHPCSEPRISPLLAGREWHRSDTKASDHLLATDYSSIRLPTMYPDMSLLQQHQDQDQLSYSRQFKKYDHLSSLGATQDTNPDMLARAHFPGQVQRSQERDYHLNGYQQGHDPVFGNPVAPPIAPVFPPTSIGLPQHRRIVQPRTLHDLRSSFYEDISHTAAHLSPAGILCSPLELHLDAEAPEIGHTSVGGQSLELTDGGPGLDQGGPVESIAPTTTHSQYKMLPAPVFVRCPIPTCQREFTVRYKDKAHSCDFGKHVSQEHSVFWARRKDIDNIVTSRWPCFWGFNPAHKACSGTSNNAWVHVKDCHMGFQWPCACGKPFSRQDARTRHQKKCKVVQPQS